MFNHLFNNSFNSRIKKFKECSSGRVCAYLINLDRATERFNLIVHSIEAIGFPYEKISAIDGRNLSKKKIESITDIKTYKSYFKMLPEPGTIGCSLSHEKVWRKFLESGNEFALIFEDDVEFNPIVLKEVITSAIGKSSLWDLINLEPLHHGVPVKIAKLNNNKSLVIYITNIKHSGCYMINRRAAYELLKKFYPIKMPIDHYFTAAWEFNIKLAGIEQRFVHQKVGDSQIKLSPPKKFGNYEIKISNAVYNFKRAIICFLYNLFIIVKLTIKTMLNEL